MAKSPFPYDFADFTKMMRSIRCRASTGRR